MAIPANILGNMNVADADGTAITAAIMAAGHQGTALTAAGDWAKTGLGLTVESAGSDRLDSVVLYGSGTSFAANSTHRRFACLHTTNFNYMTGSTTVLLNFRALAWRGWITFGPADIGGLGTTPYDYISLYKGSHFAVFQLLPGAGPSGGGGAGGYSVNIESNGAPTHSPYYTITPGARYWVDFQADFVAGTTSAKLYDTSGVLVHTITSTCDTSAVPNDTTAIHMGNREAGVSAGNTSYFENWTIDYMAAAAPFGPIGPSSYWTYKYDTFLDNTSGTTISCVVPNVATGDLVCMAAMWEQTTTTISSATDGTTAMTVSAVGVQNNGGTNGEPHMVVYYIPAAVATGTVTYTITLAAAKQFRKGCAFACTPPSGSGAITLDGTATSNQSSTGNTTSGNITTTSTNGIAFSPISTFGQSFYGPTINGVRGVTCMELSNQSMMAALAYTSGFTGGGASTTVANNRWNQQIIAFNAAAAAPAATGMLLMF